VLLGYALGPEIIVVNGGTNSEIEMACARKMSLIRIEAAEADGLNPGINTDVARGR
jgi:hypothetical protein